MNTEGGLRGRILVVDDEEDNVRMLERVLQHGGYTEILCVTDSREAVEAFMRFRPDLVLLDLHMPHLDGFAVLAELAARISRGTYLPILVLTGDDRLEPRQRALAAGAKDFLTKPFDTTEVLLRINNLIEARFLYLELQGQNARLEEKVRERTRDIEQAEIEILERLALAAEFRDDATRQHTQRVGSLSERLARRLGLDETTAALVRLAAPLHDLGKIGIPDQVLLKLDRLTSEEFQIIKTHTVVGARILSGSRYPLLQLAEQIALTHHEHWDGSGYTPGLRGEAIPLVSRIVAVVDVFDALTHDRPYKPAWAVSDAVEEIERQSGAQFDPTVVQAFVELLEEDGLLTRAGTAGGPQAVESA